MVYKDECDGGKMVGVNCNLESSKKCKIIYQIMENEDENGDVDSFD